VVYASQEYVGSYRLLNLLMTGQTSQVWEVMHGASQERRALKFLLSDYFRHREHVTYLKHEFAVGSKLKHERVIQMYDLGVHAGSPYLVMEYFPFPNLKQHLLRGTGRIAHLVPKIVEQAADALGYFNDQGWVHRDIKPDNYLMHDNGDIKLIDFALAVKRKTGLAKMFSGRSKIQGTRSYMSPEQIRGQALDQRADVYSFGCMTHELIGGKPPFTGISSNELLNKHLRHAPPSLLSVDSNVTPEFAALIQRTLAKKPEKRPESMAEFGSELRAIRVFNKTPPPPAENPDEENVS